MTWPRAREARRIAAGGRNSEQFMHVLPENHPKCKRNMPNTRKKRSQSFFLRQIPNPQQLFHRRRPVSRYIRECCGKSATPLERELRFYSFPAAALRFRNSGTPI